MIGRIFHMWIGFWLHIFQTCFSSTTRILLVLGAKDRSEGNQTSGPTLSIMKLGELVWLR